MLKLKNAAVLCALTAGLISGPLQAKECGEVSITEMDWASAAVVTSVSKFLMEEGYGCSVTVVPSASVPALASVAETGEPDILTEIWTNGAPIYQKLVDEGKIEPLTEVLSDGAVEGWWIPNYLVEKHPVLATLEGVKANPDLVDGRFHNCPEGWTCKTVSSNIALAADLAGSGIEDFVHGSGETLSTSIAAAFVDKAPWFGYYWAPTSIIGKYPMTLVDMGPYDAEGHTCNSKQDCTTPMVGAFPKSIVTTVVSRGFAAENPVVTDLMRNVAFTNPMMNSILSWKEENKASGDEAAVYFISNNSDLWSGWLNDEARAKLSALIK
ncbi:MAG: glycine betaine/proline transport system substrate-binding protein [Polaribacter sp.]|jgi:glycine betaine/proline transport system substrate-binding protein